MSNPNDSHSSLTGVLLVTSFFGLVFVGLGIGFSPHENITIPAFLVELSAKLGEALLIAVVLAAAVDKYIKNELAHEIAKDAISVAVGYELPTPFKEELNYLLRMPFERKDFTVKFEITPIASKDSYVKAIMTTTYSVCSLAKFKTVYLLRSRIEQTLFPLAGENNIDTVEWKDGSDSGSMKSCELKPKPDLTGTFLEFEKELPLIKDVPLSVTTIRSAHYPSTYSHVLDLLEPTAGVTIEVGPSIGYEWTIYFSHHDIKTSHIPPSRYEHKGLHLPGQHIRITWTKKP